MLKKALIDRLYKYNVHIGSLTPYKSRLNYYISGKRHDFLIININKSFFLLKKALYFLNKLSTNHGTLLFYYSSYMNLDIIYKCVLLSICKNSNQQIITYNWIYGSIGNYFFSFYTLTKDITFTWLKRHAYLFNIDSRLNKYYNLDDEKKTFEYLFTTKWKLKKRFHKENKFRIGYSTWYRKWLKSTDISKFWIFQKSSNRHNNFLTKLCLNDINNIWKKKKLLSFKFLLAKFYYHISTKKKDPFLYEQDSGKSTHSEYHLYPKFRSYWRFILYFKYFNNYYNIPDAIFSIYPNKDNLPLKEFSSSSLVSLGLVDTDCDIYGIHYPIISNDDSLIIVLFYFSLFSNTFTDNKVYMHALLYGT